MFGGYVEGCEWLDHKKSDRSHPDFEEKEGLAQINQGTQALIKLSYV
jgi:hypothetical protein